MAKTPQCQAPPLRPLAANQPAHEAEVIVRTGYGIFLGAAIVDSSGDPDFDKHTIECLHSAPLGAAAGQGMTTFFVWTASRDGAVSIASDHPPQWGKPAIESQRQIHDCTLSYPGSEASAHHSGQTILTYRIAADGSTSDVQVEDSSGHPAFDDAATACVSQWKFEALQPGEDASPEVHKAAIRWTLPVNNVYNRLAYYGLRCARSVLKSGDLATVTAPTIIEIANRGVKTDVTSSTTVIKSSSGNSDLDERARTCFEDVAEHYDNWAAGTNPMLFPIRWK